MIKFWIFLHCLMFSITVAIADEIEGYWENSNHAVLIQKPISNFQAGEIVWYTTGFTVGEDVWYNGQLYYSFSNDSYCADLYPGNTTFPTVINHSRILPLGTICIDTIDEMLLIGYSVTMRDFGNCLLFSWGLHIPQLCTGDMDMFKKY